MIVMPCVCLVWYHVCAVRDIHTAMRDLVTYGSCVACHVRTHVCVSYVDLVIHHA